MTTLFDAFKKRLAPGEIDANQPAPQQGNIQNIAAAKTGKASSSTGPRASSLGEAQAIGASQAQAGQLQLQGQAAAAELAGEEQNLAAQQRLFDAGQAAEARTAAGDLAAQGAATREDLATREQLANERRQSEEGLRTAAITAGAQNKLKEMATERRVAVDDIFSDFRRSNLELEFRKDAAEVEQMGFLMALSDKAYLDELDRIGRERALDDDMNFREEMYRLTFGQNLSDLTDQLDWQSKYNDDQRVLDRDLAKIDVSFAIKLAEAAIKDEGRQAMVQGTVEAGKAGADYWAKNPPKPATETEPSPTTSNPVQSSSGYPVMEG